MKHYKKPGYPHPIAIEDDGSQDHLITEEMVQIDSVELAAMLAPLPLTKEQRIAHILATQGQGKDRMTIQMAIQLAELIATIQAPAHGMTAEQAIAYTYSKNHTYKRSKDTEAACRAVELEP